MSTTATVLSTELIPVVHAKLHPAPDNLRGTLTDVDDLAQSIAEAGLLQPLRVTPHPTKAGQWMIIAGHRRHAAIGRLIDSGRWRKTQPIACIHDGVDVDDQARVQAMLIENLQRVDLDPIEEANGYQRLAGEFGMSVRDIAEKVGRSKSVISARTSLLKLPEDVRTAVSEGNVPLELANKLSRLPAAKASKLVKSAGKHLTDWMVDQELRSHERTEWLAKAKASAKTAGLTISKEASWRLDQDGWTKVHTDVTAAGLAKVIVNGDGHIVVLDEYNQKCTVWAPPAPAPTDPAFYDPTTPKVVLSPLAQAQKDWRDRNSQMSQSYIDDRGRWNQRRTELLAKIARSLPTKDVAASALMWIICQADGAIDEAAALGFDPTVEGEDSFDMFEQWCKTPANLTALAALVMLTGFEDVPIKQAAVAQVDNELGPKPTHPRDVIGYHEPYSHEAAIAFYQAIGITTGPTIDALRAELAQAATDLNDPDDDVDVDENAHLDAIDDNLAGDDPEDDDL